VNGDEELGDVAIIQDEAGGNVVLTDGLEVVLLYEAGNLILKIADLDAVSLIAGVDCADKTHNDGL